MSRFRACALAASALLPLAATAQATAPETPPAGTCPPETTAQARNTIEGNVRRVDTNRIVLTDDAGRPTSVLLDDETRVTKGGFQIARRLLAPGVDARATVVERPDGRHATDVEILQQPGSVPDGSASQNP